jgi:hypothetical protein
MSITGWRRWQQKYLIDLIGILSSLYQSNWEQRYHVPPCNGRIGIEAFWKSCQILLQRLRLKGALFLDIFINFLIAFLTLLFYSFLCHLWSPLRFIWWFSL